ncbi:MAG: pyridoxal-dependent decarboxylase [Duncaniella sp.]|uniref:pyridoxal-dependent decarboxylase n=1 Tax=Duncaniella sp. TaxID=2518496 RepID=UPI0023C6CA44|nr:pyridoxal-dependent decarboxylase [Duncaniella sp.]MDE6091308.1 pyridoxal-dependent decarboxylase [Duncaniella sp.]
MTINKEIIAELRTQFGDAFYLLDSERFINNFKELRNAFRRYYPNSNIAYSYKTNYAFPFCKIVNELGGYAEVVSEMELEIALRIGVNPERIIWNGPIKNPIILEKFLLAGGTDNIDNKEELEIVRKIACQHPGKTINIGIRVNYEVGDGVISRFGFDIETDEFKDVLHFVTATPNVHFKNFQCHFAKRQIQYWPARTQGMLDLIDGLDIVPERIDIGGGLFGKMEDSLKAQFSCEIPDYDAYAEVSAKLFAEYFQNKDKKPELLIEPGSAIVGDCMKFVGTVMSIKNVRGKWFASVLASQKNISMSGVNPPLVVININPEEKKYENLDFVGFTCIEGDVLYHGYSGPLAVGDVIVISNCGSYSIVMKPPFILPNFPILDISSDTVNIVKRAESFDDILHTYNF